MGMFDTFYGTYTCPKCGKSVDFEEQSKDYDCCLSDFKLGDLVDNEQKASHFYDFQYECPFCKAQTNLSIGIKNGQYVGVYYAEDAHKMSVDELANIEEGYQRKRDYEEMCRKKLGSEELGRVTSDVIALKPGETIRALETDWEVLEAYKEENAKHIKSEREYFWRSFFERPTFVYKVKGADEYRIITICLNPNTLKLYCDVYEDGLDHIDHATEDEATDHRYHLTSDCRLKKLEDSIDNRFVITKRIDVYHRIRRKIICISNSYDPIGDGNYQTLDELEVGKEYTVMPQTGISGGEFIYLEELPSAKGYPASLFEEKSFYCENTLLDMKKEFLLETLEKSEEDIRQGRVRTIEGLFQNIKDSVKDTREDTDIDRIQGYVNTLTRVWNKHPDLRFGQLIQYALMDRKLWDIDDDRLFNTLAKFEDT